MERIILSMPDLPNTNGLAVLGGTTITAADDEMARLVGQQIVAAERTLVTGGRRGAGEAAARGADVYCRGNGWNSSEWIFSLVPSNHVPDFTIGTTLTAGADRTERRILLIKCTQGAVVVGGGRGTEDEINIATLQAIMNAYSIIPACGTGIVADRMCRAVGRSRQESLDHPGTPGAKAAAIITRLLAPKCWLCDVDPTTAHNRWFLDLPVGDPVAQRMHRLRHQYF